MCPVLGCIHCAVEAEVQHTNFIFVTIFSVFGAGGFGASGCNTSFKVGTTWSRKAAAIALAMSTAGTDMADTLRSYRLRVVAQNQCSELPCVTPIGHADVNLTLQVVTAK